MKAEFGAITGPMKTRTKEQKREHGLDAMFTFHNGILRRAGGFIAALCAAMAFCAGSATDCPRPARACQRQHLTNAQALVGSTGIGQRRQFICATAEVYTNLNGIVTNEPAPFPGNPAQASIWYVWTAPYTTMMDFKTRGSSYISGPNAGGQLDTVMAVYKLNSGNAIGVFTTIWFRWRPMTMIPAAASPAAWISLRPWARPT